MNDITFEIGRYNRATHTVPVVFTNGEIFHNREVNAVLNEDQTYDKAATKQRVAEVARGVAHKIAVGAISNLPPESEPQPDLEMRDAPADNTLPEA